VGGPSNASATALYVNDITIAANGGTYRCGPRQRVEDQLILVK
jgi:hypothetical protein